MTSTIEAIATLIGGAKRIVVFTGAGISAESGIPTFRDPLTGIWAHHDPEKLETANAFRADAALVWGWYLWRRAQVARAEPNAAHLAIVHLAKTRQVTVVTQNIDDLHERAGSTDVIHLHGSLAQPKCFACHRIPADQSFENPIASEGLKIEPPRCPRCKGKLRPGVVWFGEDLPAAAWQSGAYVVHVNPAPVALQSNRVFCLIGRAAEQIPALVSLIGSTHPLPH
ncbi:Sir2 family NAD-dependent protein deacetylase [Pseudomonas sp. McL0111]|uniref:Sir2 family NAD-dependent protein deacetylase n=1 Tax=Pseudomonas sp. McL0111 TaxID=3457357 RepID=UPI00403EF32A